MDLFISLHKVTLLSTFKNESRLLTRHFSSLWSHPNEKVTTDPKQQLPKNSYWYGTNTQSEKPFLLKDSIKQITIQTCGPLYAEWRETRKAYVGAPKEGLSFNVEYVDTKEYVNNDKAPVLLTLHGAPGSHEAFHPLINHLAPKGVRVIAPNWPEYAAIDWSKYFRHSTEEKTNFLHDFLRAIDVDRLDTVVSHSSGIYPSLSLYSDKKFPIKSIVLISPGAHRRTAGMKPAWFTDNLVRFTLNPIGRTIYRKCYKYAFKLIKPKIEANNPDNVILAATVMHLSGWTRLPELLEVVRQQKPNLLYIFGDQDKLIEKEFFYEIAQILGAKDVHYTNYDGEGNCLAAGSKDDWIQIMKFEKAGHYPFLKYANIVNLAIEEFIKK
ncbi:uncharacterized protein LOC107362135 isoform X2 [Tetranychus urticae]|uniref:uncharacterized protein LOC107362135 isoform X2 n=1 Tax=Tetranychus urticae TaxID=32264 RepID=UPI00077B9D95|nr:uncharacterized protein LOC107362135 isoform X2 [Tetranychus urticae]